ncbi:hypothetical protein [Bacillus thuringiensis]|uniref:Uncharacterized protein n=1 Tax=Bacillus thuringiensis TaxID=1428 RepID=A0A9X6TRL9_BACTU|nr:hypothetical protein [Bacillus thuringiensis]PEA91146.1 hypothetical protein CON71_04790 [Bacillus thuringiensis]
MKKLQIIYTLISPNGDRDTIGPILMYATTENIIKQRLDKELHRRMGDLYQWEIDVKQIENEQLVLL